MPDEQDAELFVKPTGSGDVIDPITRTVIEDPVKKYVSFHSNWMT
jgi:hypothetical protein